MTMVVLIVAALMILIVVALASQIFRGKASPETTKTAKPKTADASPKPPFTPSDRSSAEPQDIFHIAVYNESSGIYKELRSHLINGIDKVLGEKMPDEPDLSIPRMRDQVDPAVLQNVLGYVEGMDKFRARQFELQKLLNDPRSQLAELSKNITSDPLLTTKVLKMANSSYFGFTQKIDSIGHALMILGLQNVKNILYREGMKGLFDAGPAHNKAVVAQLWRHSNLVCICTQHFHDLFEGLNRGTLFTLGIVHDIGKLILMDVAHKGSPKAVNGEAYPLDIMIGEEDQFFGINHAVIGGYTLEHWNFSELMSLSVTMHHVPSFIEAGDVKLSPEILKYILALFLADQVAKLFADWHESTARIYPLLPSYHGLIDKKKLLNKITDVHFLNQLQAAETLAASEHPLAFQKVQPQAM